MSSLTYISVIYSHLLTTEYRVDVCRGLVDFSSDACSPAMEDGGKVICHTKFQDVLSSKKLHNDAMELLSILVCFKLFSILKTSKKCNSL